MSQDQPKTPEKSSGYDSDISFREQLSKFLDNLSERTMTSNSCPRCGSTQRLVTATFFMLEFHRCWKIPLPLCCVCLDAENCTPNFSAKPTVPQLNARSRRIN